MQSSAAPGIIRPAGKKLLDKRARPFANAPTAWGVSTDFMALFLSGDL
jgi:hypothetical protein